MTDEVIRKVPPATDENIESELGTFGIAFIYSPGDEATPYLIDPRKVTVKWNPRALDARERMDTSFTHHAFARLLREARAEGYIAGEKAGKKGRITMDEARDLASTYRGGEGNHPLARHRDSMG